MRNPEDQSRMLITCIDNTGRSPVLTLELVPVNRHGLPVQVVNDPDQSSRFLNKGLIHLNGFVTLCKRFVATEREF